MDVPLWLAVAAIGYLGVKHARPPWWLVALLLLGGYLVAHSFLGPVVGSLIN
ncbi:MULTISPECIES: hypothetical protein [unclassified Streptomyces]|uniref:hypothetical protein n=1 Tax=unclassified Streptomyces TaxID=2593676 RepID=UPI000AC2ECD7|nr:MULTISPECIES: hypothetical protein [unclassified Streptomyces]